MSTNLNQTSHLAESDLDPFQPDCVFCRSESRFSCGSLQENPKIELLRCSNCALVSASRIPSAKTLEQYYQAYYENKQMERRQEKVACQAPQVLAAHLRRRVEPFLATNELSVLDFGGGDGSVAKFLALPWAHRGKTIEIQVIDYNPTIVARSDTANLSIRKAADLKDVKNTGFDLVLASAVLEHIAYPRQSLKILLEHVRPGGIFYARTPYMVPLRQLAATFGKRVDFTYPAHIHDMGSLFWRRILQTLDLQDRFEIVLARPSVVETTLHLSPIRTVLAVILKSPWYLFGDCWGLVGGWEIYIRRRI